MTRLCMFMTQLNVLATPEKNIKIYIQIKKLCHFNLTFIERKHINESILPVYDTHILQIFTILKSQYLWI